MLTARDVDSIALGDEEFRKVVEFIYRRTGMAFADAKRYFVTRRVAERVIATESPHFASWFAMLRFDESGAELERLVNGLTINETYFFREEHQFACLTSSILPEITKRKRPGDGIRIWSLPCSTGEEPYSIAIWLLENWSEVDRWNVEIVGSDIDTGVLAAARHGMYDARSLHRLPKPLHGRYFHGGPGGGYRILDTLRGSIEFTRVNVSDRAQVLGHGSFDVIFCRNMLIYFDDTSRREAAENMHDCLEPGGYICLGHSESMSRISTLFEVRRFADAIVHRRPFKS